MWLLCGCVGHVCVRVSLCSWWSAEGRANVQIAFPDFHPGPKAQSENDVRCVNEIYCYLHQEAQKRRTMEKRIYYDPLSPTLSSLKRVSSPSPPSPLPVQVKYFPLCLCVVKWNDRFWVSASKEEEESCVT